MMTNRFDSGGRPDDGLGRDMILAESLSALDPGSEDPGYWFRFRDWVVAEAGPELARRRLMAELTVADVLTSWSRAIVPTAVMAAGVAGLLLATAETPTLVADVGFETAMIEAEPVLEPALLSSEELARVVTFAADPY